MAFCLWFSDQFCKNSSDQYEEGDYLYANKLKRNLQGEVKQKFPLEVDKTRLYLWLQLWYVLRTEKFFKPENIYEYIIQLLTETYSSLKLFIWCTQKRISDVTVLLYSLMHFSEFLICVLPQKIPCRKWVMKTGFWCK